MNCIECNNEFKPKRKEQVFCSRKCSCLSNGRIGADKTRGIKTGSLSKWIREKISKANKGVQTWGGSRNTPWMIGENNCNWKGDEVDYHDLHKWVTRWKGNIKKCEMCGLDDKNKRYHWANIDHKYKRVLEDYIRLCPKCHGQYDKNKGLRKRRIQRRK